MFKKIPSKLINRSIKVGLGSFCLFSVINLQSAQKEKISETTLTKEQYLKQEKAYELKLSLFKKMPTFGFSNLVADLTMMDFMLYFGDGKARKQTGYSLSDDYLELIVNNDPHFARAYMFISPASSMFGGTPKRTIELLDRALKHLTPNIPDAYFVWIYKGTDEILFFGDLEKAKKSYESAAKWATVAEDDKIAKSAKNTVKFLASNPNIINAQVGAWLQVFANNKEQNIRDIAKEKIEQLGGELKIYPNGEVQAIPPKISKS